jgi:hypothetical protein
MTTEGFIQERLYLKGDPQEPWFGRRVHFGHSPPAGTPRKAGIGRWWS